MVEFDYRQDLLRSSLSPWLDHFRWIAATLVAAAHLRNVLFPDASEASLSAPAKIFYFFTLFGTQSVVIFFVLSGLLVGGVLVRALEGLPFDGRKYGLDRSIRLYLALIPALILSVVLQHTAGGCVIPDGGVTILGNALYLQNFAVEPLCNNHPLWSLSSEAYFYLIAPFLVLAVIRKSPALALAGFALLLLSLTSYNYTYGHPLIGLSLWLCGLAPWFLRIRLPAIVAAMPLATVLLASRLHLFSTTTTENLLIAAALTILLCSNLCEVSVPFSNVAKRVSAFSYSLYLVHMPIAQAFGAYIGAQTLPPGKLSSYLVYAGIFGVIFFVAWLFGRLFESRTHAVRNALRTLIGRRPAQPHTKAR